jgi:Cupin-like domain
VKRIQIERKSHTSAVDVAREHLSGIGKPVIITDATDLWPARSKWTFEYFKTAYGSDVATAWLGRGSGTGKVTTISAYIDFLDGRLAELPGLWAGSDIGNDGRPPSASIMTTSPFYLFGWYAFKQHPELYDDILPTPYFVQDLVSSLEPWIRRVFEWTSEREYTGIYIGPKGSLSALHRDYWSTHGYLSQIQGRKLAILFSPEDTDFLYGGRVDPEQPDLERFPLFDRATSYEGIIGPGDTLFTPANWWHHIKGLEKSITVSHNFFNETNITEHMTHILRNLPLLVQGIEKSPDCRRELGIEWSSSDLTAMAPRGTTVFNWSGFHRAASES